MCFGSGGSSSAQDQANANEAARQATITTNDASINSLFDSPDRQAQIGNFLDASRQFYTNDLNRQKTQNDLQLKFAEARGGQTGGSVAVDAGTRSGQDYQTGLINAERLAQQGASNLRGQDQSAKLNLLSLAQSGANTTTINQEGASYLQNDLASAKAGNNLNEIGGAFNDFSNMYADSVNNAKLRQQSLYPSINGIFSGPVGPYAGAG